MSREHPILFSAPMIHAIMDGRKTQSRRMSEQWMKLRAGDRLWVRETWRTLYGYNDHPPSYVTSSEPVWFDADGKCPWLAAGKGRPSIFMPRWASRITLEATSDARREHLLDISNSDAIDEGIERLRQSGGFPLWKNYRECKCGDPCECNESDWFPDPTSSFRSLWDFVNGKRHPWSSNPVVVCLTFTVIEISENKFSG